jgi:tripartite-type tricarboxylate transporter receptor subunit TctC
MFLNAGPAEATARDGRAKIIGVGATSRIPLLPNTPTLAELGMPIEAANWFGLLGPAGMPASVANRIAEIAAEGLRSPQVQEVFRVQAALPLTGAPEAMRDFVAADRERWAAVVRDLNIRLE